MLISDSTFGIPKKNHEKMILFDSYLKSPFYLENLYKYFEKKIQDLDYLWILGVGR